MSKKTYGQRIREIRNELTQEEFGKIIDKSRSTICEYEKGDGEPDFDTLIKISKYGNRTIDWIVKGKESKIPKDEQEKRFLEHYREAKELDVVDKIEHFAKYTIDEAKREKSAKTTSKAA